jgi:CheY-like chemotaxis protein
VRRTNRVFPLEEDEVMGRAAVPLEGRRILVVEDDYLVAEDICAILQDAGAVAVGPVGWVNEALELIHRNKNSLDGVVLDIDLHGESSYPVADVLVAHDIPFVFATGYNADAIKSAYHHYPRCLKPIDLLHLLRGLSADDGGMR